MKEAYNYICLCTHFIARTFYPNDKKFIRNSAKCSLRIVYKRGFIQPRKNANVHGYSIVACKDYERKSIPWRSVAKKGVYRARNDLVKPGTRLRGIIHTSGMAILKSSVWISVSYKASSAHDFSIAFQGIQCNSTKLEKLLISNITCAFFPPFFL